MIARPAALALAALLVVTAARAQDTLDGPAIEAALAGATVSGVNTFGNPYTVRILPDGTTEGVAGHDDEYTDTGRWWVADDAYCRQWDTWLDGEAACFSVAFDGDSVIWQDTATGSVHVEDYRAPQ